MIPSKRCYDLIKKFEGLFLNGYICPAGVPSIGWGTTIYPAGAKVKITDKITEADANKYLEYEVNEKAKEIEPLIKGVTLTQNQFDAIVCFAYNVGVSAFRNSTLRKLIQSNPKHSDIPAAFAMWNKARVDGKMVELKGLTKRRASEAALYLT